MMTDMNANKTSLLSLLYVAQNNYAVPHQKAVEDIVHGLFIVLFFSPKTVPCHTLLSLCPRQRLQHDI